jgi:hypothetical protein
LSGINKVAVVMAIMDYAQTAIAFDRLDCQVQSTHGKVANQSIIMAREEAKRHCYGSLRKVLELLDYPVPDNLLRKEAGLI